jgi:hypothetical protein
MDLPRESFTIPQSVHLNTPTSKNKKVTTSFSDTGRPFRAPDQTYELDGKNSVQEPAVIISK